MKTKPGKIVSYIYKIYYVYKKKGKAFGFHPRHVRKYKDDFDAARADYLYMTQEEPERYLYVCLVRFHLIGNKLLKNEKPTVISIKGELNFDMYGIYCETDQAFKETFGIPEIVMLKDNVAERLKISERDYICRYKPDPTKFAVIYDIGNGWWNFYALINECDVVSHREM